MKDMEVQNVFHMNGGSGETSYAQNSLLQKKIISSTKPIIEDVLCSTNIKESFGIADLGCSTGHNTLQLVSDVIGIIEGMCLDHLHLPIPEFRVYLNDLPGNDFNTLFMSLPEFHEKLESQKVRERDSSTACFIAGVAGSFYGRLFPTGSLDFVHSASSLHWLSQVPPGLDNKGSIYISKTSPPSVADAYLAQFKRDFSLFLKSRSEEVVAGGCMVLTLMVRPSREGFLKFDLLSHLLNDMVSEGLIEKEKVDSFNLPYYEPSTEELKLVIEREGSFVLNHQSVCNVDWDATGPDHNTTTKEEMGIRGEYVARGARAVTESLLKEQFGEEVLENVFHRLAALLNDVPRENAKFTFITVSLVRKA